MNLQPQQKLSPSVPARVGVDGEVVTRLKDLILNCSCWTDGSLSQAVDVVEKSCFQFPTEQPGPTLPVCEAAQAVGAIWHRAAHTARPSASDRHILLVHR